MPRSSIRPIGLAPISGMTHSLRLESGQTVSVIPASTMPLDQRRILERAIAVVDPVDVQHVERLGDVGGRPFLAGVGDQLQALRAGGGEHPGELRRRMADLGGIEPDPGDPVEPRLGLGKRRQCRLLVEVPQEAQDQARGDPVARLARGEPAARSPRSRSRSPRRVRCGPADRRRSRHGGRCRHAPRST